VDLAESGGLRTQRELWVTALDPVTGMVLDHVGPRLLGAVAGGTLVDVDAKPRGDLLELLQQLDLLVAERRTVTQELRRQDNAALVEARIASRERALDLKIEKAEATLRDVEDQGRSDRLLRMHRGRVKNLRADRAAVRAELEGRKQLDLTLTPVAVLQVHPA